MSVLGDFFSAFWDVASNSATYEVALRFAAVLGFAAIGEWVAEKSGSMNISLEAMILGAAFAATIGYDISGSTLVGIVFGVLAGLLISGVQANMSHRLQVNQFVVGLTLNVLVLALVGFLLVSLNPVATTAAKVNITLLVDIPLIGEALFGQRWIIYLILPLGLGAWILVYKTRWGLEIRAVGENPDSANAVGIPVALRRRQAIYFCGISAGFAGSYLLLGQIGRFENNIVGGQGFIAIAAVIFGGWRLRGALLGCLLFGLANSLRLLLPALGHPLNTELLSAFPFLLTILMVATITYHKNRRVLQPRALNNL